MKFNVAHQDGNDKYPNEPGVYVVQFFSRDGMSLLEVLGFDPSRVPGDCWIKTGASEYGYAESVRLRAEYIHAWAKIDGAELHVVTEKISIKIPGLEVED